MQPPYQAIGSVQSEGGQHLLLAACGPSIVALSLDNNTIACEWPPRTKTATQQEPEDGERPAKKQKTEKPPTPQNIIKLAVAPNNLYAAVVTEDKCLHVLSIDESGKLEELSQRVMPKRPCALQFHSDNSTILIGDKFGDVYSLPLLPLEKEDYDVVSSAISTQPLTQEKAYKPSASILTVHTQRNRKALEAQLKQKNMTPKTKEPLKFEHKLLLGHVSMLTDMLTASREVESKHRDYIITADRDEHIRVSRGIPQAHIIEGYCLGHTQFVSRLCLVPHSDILISGGGDNWLGVWHWPSYTLKRKLDVRKAVDKLTVQRNLTFNLEVAVSGLWTIPTQNSPDCKTFNLLVACEAFPALFAFAFVDGEPQSDSPTVLELPHTPLDVAHVGNTAITTLDARHSGEERLIALTVELEGVDKDAEFESKLQVLSWRPWEDVDGKALDALLFGVANLRKRGNVEEDGGREE